jgi:hypothetical protein
MELFKASRQWASRPDDERFTSIDALHAATRGYADEATERSVPWSVLRTEADGPDVKLVGKGSVPSNLTNWAFGQLSARIGAPAEYLRKLPPTLAVQNLNHGLANRVEDKGDGNAQILFHTNGGLLARALTTDKYSRIWNYEVAERLVGLQGMGWEPATPDIRGYADPDDKRNFALYASDHDLFAFLRNRNLAIEVGGTTAQREKPVYRGVIVENSEVGAASLKLTRFLYNEMCGNHIIWGASKVVDLTFRHVGNVRDRMYIWSAELRRYAAESSSDESAKIASAKTVRIADTKEGVLDKLFGIRTLALGKKVLEASYDAVKPEQDGDPKTVWGMVQGITRHSQTIPYADKRTDLDRSAGKLLAMSF